MLSALLILAAAAAIPPLGAAEDQSGGARNETGRPHMDDVSQGSRPNCVATTTGSYNGTDANATPMLWQQKVYLLLELPVPNGTGASVLVVVAPFECSPILKVVEDASPSGTEGAESYRRVEESTPVLP